MGTDCLITEVKKILKYLKRLKFDSCFRFLFILYKYPGKYVIVEISSHFGNLVMSGHASSCAWY